MSHLYERFYPYWQERADGYAYYSVSKYIMNSKKRVKVFSVKKYKTKEKAYEAAAEYFSSIYGFKPS